MSLACTRIERSGLDEGPVKVLFGMDNGTTKTTLDAEEKRFHWDEGDKIAVWAKGEGSDVLTLSAQEFSLLASTDDSRELSYFISTLPSPMQEGRYTYYVSYPVPQSSDGAHATFALPAVQDGKASSGVGIVISEPTEGAALPVTSESTASSDSQLAVRLKHLLHYLRFYIPEGANTLGAPIEQISLKFPAAVAGTVDVDVTDLSTARLSDGGSELALKLAYALDESSETARKYAVAAVFPPASAYSAADKMEVRLYSADKWADVEPVSLASRTFDAGHITGVPLRPGAAKDYRYELVFRLASNNLGEEVQKITMTLPDGKVWPGTSSGVYEFAPAEGTMAVGQSFVLATDERAQYTSLSSASVVVTYESENARVSETLTLPELSPELYSPVISSAVALNCPYLFFEDFSGVASFSSNDEYATSSAGSKNPVSFLNGWSAARAGAEAGKAIRIAARRETWLASYPARADSKFIGLKDGKRVNLAVSFDYSMGRQGTSIYQTVYLGYINTGSNYKSSDDTGTFPVNFRVDETSGSYDVINHTYSGVLENVPAPVRLSWRTECESKTAWTTCWLYIDNIKVKISK